MAKKLPFRLFNPACINGVGFLPKITLHYKHTCTDSTSTLSLSRPESNRDHMYTSQAPRPNSSGAPQARVTPSLTAPEKTTSAKTSPLPCRMTLSLWSSRRYFSSDVSATVPIRGLRDDTHGPRPSEPSELSSKGSSSNWWAFRRLGFFTGELEGWQHAKSCISIRCLDLFHIQTLWLSS